MVRSAFAGAILTAAGLLTGSLLLLLGQPGESAGLSELDAPLFDRERLVEHARSLSLRPFEPAFVQGDSTLGMNYDQYRSVAFDRDQAIWKEEGAPFQLELFHPGFIFNVPVEISLVDPEGRVTPLDFDPSQFTYGGEATPPEGDVDYYSGFRVHAPLNTPERWDEFAVFQGATYFRGVGAGEMYGLSARALAIATGEPEGEEFPYFRKFWIEQPAEDGQSLVVHALMDSPSVTGAYRFTITPGDMTLTDVEAALFPRVELGAVGIAPLTSMFLFDQTNRWGYDDFRNAVHDSDGLMIVNGAGEQIWRPLANPRRLQISAFVDDNPRGFGLMQRKREADDFNDFNARYEDRPSAWIEPIGDWGRGSIVLVEIPTDSETNDNIVAFWRPRTPLTPGLAHHIAYRMHWGADAPLEDTMLMRVTHTRTGASLAGKRFFVVDFSPTDLPAEYLIADGDASAGTMSQPHLVRDERTGVMRATFELDPQGADLVEVRLRLTAGGSPASETWLYRWTPG